MAKKRLIFVLHYSDGVFALSRNFRLQKVGDFGWLKKHYGFNNIANAIDELVILDVSRNRNNSDQFIKVIREVVNECFIPVIAGGGIRDEKYAHILFHSGADKIIVNSALMLQPELIRALVKLYGSQAIVASIDYKINNDKTEAYILNGTQQVSLAFDQYLDFVIELGVGELFLNSIQRDGTGQGYDCFLHEKKLETVQVPVVVSGGAGNYKHLLEGIKQHYVDGVATANIYNFISDGLLHARQKLKANHIDLATWL